MSTPLAKAVAANPERYYYTDAAGKLRWGNKKSAKREEIDPKIARGRLIELLNPKQCKELGREWPVLRTPATVVARTPIPALEDRKPMDVSRETSEAPELAPESATPVPNYDAQAAQVEAATVEAAETAELEVEIDAEQVRDMIEFAADSILDLLVVCAYIGSPVAARRAPTDKERKMWHRGITKYAEARMPENLTASPELALAVTAGMVLAPTIMHAHGGAVAAFMAGRGDR
jgi:hypothetical protein